jgi:hypothetical protein
MNVSYERAGKHDTPGSYRREPRPSGLGKVSSKAKAFRPGRANSVGAPRQPLRRSVLVLCQRPGKHDTPARTGGSRGLQASEKSAATPRPSGPDPAAVGSMVIPLGLP